MFIDYLLRSEDLPTLLEIVADSALAYKALQKAKALKRESLITEELAEAELSEYSAFKTIVELIKLSRGWQLTVDQQVAHLGKGGLRSQLLDGVTTVAQNPSVTVDVGDGRLGCCGIHETRVIGDRTSGLE